MGKQFKKQTYTGFRLNNVIFKIGVLILSCFFFCVYEVARENYLKNIYLVASKLCHITKNGVLILSCGFFLSIRGCVGKLFEKHKLGCV